MEPGKARRGRPKGMYAPAQQTTIQALDRALDVLEVLSRQNGITLSELAQTMGQSVATLHRVLATLEARGFAEIDPELQKWHVGAASLRIGSAFQRRTNVLERARPAMRDLMATTGETANLGIEWKGAVLFLSQVETHEAIRAFFPPGTMSPIHASGIGKALLSCKSAQAITGLVDATLEAFTPHTLTKREALIADVTAAKARGYAIDDEERALGMRCVAAPIINALGEAVAGISVSGPVARLDPARIKDVGTKVAAAARLISRQIGAL